MTQWASHIIDAWLTLLAALRTGILATIDAAQVDG
jgi:hypothetical protein